MNQLRRLKDRDSMTYGQSLLAYQCWLIWKARNEWIYHHRQPQARGVVNQALGAVVEIHSKQDTQERTVGTNNTESQWHPPPNGWVKLNCDGSYEEKRRKGAYGVVIRDHSGVFLKGEGRTMTATSALTTQAIAVRKACGLVLKEEYNAAVIELDSMLLINSINNGTEFMQKEIEQIVRDTGQYASKIPLGRFKKIKRSANMVAHTAATKAREETLSPQWLICMPLQTIDCVNYHRS
ncbi:unnamed protein product [Ilex paraguariensis]|uniref:RNase H type-1 domain-containing protein n=1 Tax=Ilex paraguariensis TaxID=185542 RepID=A0ABC8SYA5_9AQUA